MKTPKTTLALILGIIMAVLFNTFVGVVIAAVLEANATACILGMNGLGLGLNMLRVYAGLTAFNVYPGILTAGLAREVYLAELMRKLRTNGAFLAEARDLSAYVENDKINFAEAGSDPDIVQNYDHVDPLDVADDEDTAKDISLLSFSTTRSKITESAQDARAYQIMSDRVTRHADTLNESIVKYSAHAFAPSANGTYTPYVRTSGGADGSGTFKMATLNDIIDLDYKMRNLDVTGTRILVLNPKHLAELMKEDKELFKGFVPGNPDAAFQLFGFKTYVSTATPRYTTDGAPTKKAWNSVVEGTDLITSTAFVANEVARARGSVKLFMDKDTATHQASFISTRVRFIAAQMRSKYVAALITKTV